MTAPRVEKIGALPLPMQRAAAAFEQRFAVAFDTLTYLPAEWLAAIHARGGDEDALMARVHVRPDGDDVRHDAAILARVANERRPSHEARATYRDALLRMYGAIGAGIDADGDHFVVAPEREGRMLAERLGWIRAGRDATPHAKRIPYEHGLLIGVSATGIVPDTGRLVIVDGAIASGGTIIAILQQFARPGVPVSILSVHAAREGLRAILRHAQEQSLDVRIDAGFVTEGLSPKFYAVDAASGALVVGDLGDTICGIAPVERR